MARPPAAITPNPETTKLVDQSKVADSLFAQGKFAEAEKLAGRALAIQESALDPTHPDIAETLDTLAEIRNDATAEEFTSRAEAIRESAKEE